MASIDGSWYSPRARQLAARVGPIAALVFVGFLAAAVAWLRLPGIARNTLWAEDGREFLGDALHANSPIVFEPYAGYLHFIPRVIAGLIAWLVPLTRFATATTLASCAVVGAVTVVVYVCSRDVLRSRAARVVVAAVTVLIPLAPVEVLGNLANLHWYFLWSAPWLLLFRPKTWAGAYVLAFYAFAASLTEIQMIVFIPLMLWKLHDRRRWPVRIAMAAGLLAQIIATLLSPRPHAPFGPMSPVSTIRGFLFDVVLPIWLPTPLNAARVVETFGWALPWFAIAPFAIALIVVIVNRVSSRHVLLAAALAFGAVAVWLLAMFANPNPSYDFGAFSAGQVETAAPTRYGVVTAMFLVALVPVGADALLSREAGSPRRLGIVGLVLCAFLLVAQFVPVSTNRSDGPAWLTGVVNARVECVGRQSSSVVEIPVAPAGWTMRIACGRVLGGR